MTNPTTTQLLEILQRYLSPEELAMELRAIEQEGE